MADNRTRREKLEAMAAQTVSPWEADIAARLLMEMDVAAPYPEALRATERAVDAFLVRTSAFGTTVRWEGHSPPPDLLERMLKAAFAADDERDRRTIGTAPPRLRS